MKMSEEMAVRLHRMMWSDMQKELGDRPSGNDRLKFKREWVERNFPGEHIANDCWLCEYASSVVDRGGDPYCMHCPIKWPNCHCNTIGFSYAKKPISEILAVPAKSDKIMDVDDAYSYYKYREYLLSNASGIPASSAIEDHVAEIRKKEDRSVMQVLEIFSGLKGDGYWVIDHVKKIQEKAVEDYFKKTPGAKLVSMDVDDAFKQYAKEQTEPLKQMNDRLTKRYIEVKDCLALESGLDHDRPAADHIKKIRDDAFSDGEDAERERIMDRIGELLNHDFD